MEILLRISAFLLKILGYLITPFLILCNSHKKTKIPPIKNDILKLSVCELAEKLRQKEVKYFVYLFFSFLFCFCEKYAFVMYLLRRSLRKKLLMCTLNE